MKLDLELLILTLQTGILSVFCSLAETLVLDLEIADLLFSLFVLLFHSKGGRHYSYDTCLSVSTWLS